MKCCPKCGHQLGEALREGQETTCPKCGLTIVIHYSLREQLKDPIGLLSRDPKYVSKKSQLKLIYVILFVIALFFILIARGIL